MTDLKYKIIAVDFDKTLTFDDAYPDAGTLNIKAIEALKEYRACGGKIILWTLRTGQSLQNAIDACEAEGLEFDATNDNLKEQVKWWRDRNPGIEMSRKIYADLYIDDRDPVNILNESIDWDIVGYVLSMKKQDTVNNFFLAAKIKFRKYLAMVNKLWYYETRGKTE